MDKLGKAAGQPAVVLALNEMLLDDWTTNEVLQSHSICPKYDNLPVLNKGVFDVTGNRRITAGRCL